MEQGEAEKKEPEVSSTTTVPSPPPPPPLHQPTGGEVNMAFQPEPEHHRHVSISSEAVHTDLEHQRKVSITSAQHDAASRLRLASRLRAANADGLQHHGADNGRKYSNVTMEDDEPDAENSWWYLLCTKCRQKESGRGWEPSYWQSVCPYPFCPTYRHVARIVSLFATGLLTWGVIYSIIGSDAAPGGQLFDIAAVSILAHFGGVLFRMLNLPALVGMLLVGIIYQNLGLIHVEGHYAELVGICRKVALVMILIRAGLDLEPKAMKTLCFTVLRMGLIPWAVEFVMLAVLSNYILHLPWLWAVLLSSIVSAVAPAVVVPCLLRLRNKGYGVTKGIPTLVIAISGIDDAASVTAYGIIYGIIFSANSLAHDIAIGPLSIAVGLGFGITWGFFSKYFPEKEDPFVVPIRILTLLGGCLIAVFGSEVIGMEGAGPLAVIAAAFLSIYFWSKQGWKIESNPVANAFEIFWMLCEPVLFALTGIQVKFDEIDTNIIGVGSGILIACIIVRIVVTVLVGVKSSLNTREKFFVALSLMAKATVQAALGPVAVSTLMDERGSEEYRHAEVVMMICILSILLTAPLGAILISLLGKRILTKTTGNISPPEGWRRTHRPSIRDITINEHEEEEDENDNDIEKKKENSNNLSTNWQQQPPPFIISAQP